jgi:hypothetical protein
LSEAKTHYRDVNKVMPVFERHREEAVKQLSQTLSEGLNGRQ